MSGTPLTSAIAWGRTDMVAELLRPGRPGGLPDVEALSGWFASGHRRSTVVRVTGAGDLLVLLPPRSADRIVTRTLLWLAVLLQEVLVYLALAYAVLAAASHLRPSGWWLTAWRLGTVLLCVFLYTRVGACKRLALAVGSRLTARAELACHVLARTLISVISVSACASHRFGTATRRRLIRRPHTSSFVRVARRRGGAGLCAWPLAGCCCTWLATAGGCSWRWWRWWSPC